MRLILVICLLFLSSASLKCNPRSEQLRALVDQHSRRIAAHTMASTGNVLLHCGNPLNRIGYVTILAALAVDHPTR